MPDRSNDLFVKLYLRARDSGFLAAIGDRDWRTLCVLAMYMNQEGWCNPSQMSLSHSLGISRSSVARRIQHLRCFRFNGQPVIQTESQKEISTERSDALHIGFCRHQTLPFSFPIQAKINLNSSQVIHKRGLRVASRAGRCGAAQTRYIFI